MNPRVATFAEALARLPTADGRRSTFVVDDPNLALKLYAPRGSDPQKPHTRDEIYVIAQGTGEFVAQWGAGASPARTGEGAGAPLRTTSQRAARRFAGANITSFEYADTPEADHAWMRMIVPAATSIAAVRALPLVSAISR